MDLDDLERLEREATPGPWAVLDPDGDRNWVATVPDVNRMDFRRGCEVEIPHRESPTGRYYMEVPTSPGDGLFLAALRNAAPDLIGEVRALRAALVTANDEEAQATQERRRIAAELDFRIERLAVMRAANERLQSAANRRDSDLAEARAELAAARAEVERVTGERDNACAQRDIFISQRNMERGRAEKAEAEVDRVTKERDEAIKDCRSEWMVGYGQLCAKETARAEKAEAEAKQLRAHIDEAGDGMNLVGLLDLYHDREEEQRGRAEKAEAEVERLHVQLAGCSVAASGTDLDLSSDAYGWSVAFSDVAGLYRRMEKAEAEVERLRAENGNLSTLVVRTMDDMESLRTTVRALLPDVAHKVDEVAK